MPDLRQAMKLIAALYLKEYCPSYISSPRRGHRAKSIMNNGDKEQEKQQQIRQQGLQSISFTLYYLKLFQRQFFPPLTPEVSNS